MQINRKITAFNHTIMNNKKNNYIVIHYVGSVSTAKNNADYFSNKKVGSSAHYYVDEKEIWQGVEDFNASWHVGNKSYIHPLCRNFNSIGIEMCCKKDSSGKWYIEDKTVENTIELTKILMHKHNIPANRVLRHYDVTGKICPEPFVRIPIIWANFKYTLEVGKVNKEEAIKILKEKVGLSDETIAFLDCYKFAEALLIKLAKSVK